jgi:dUTP pyrophosphatase
MTKAKKATLPQIKLVGTENTAFLPFYVTPESAGMDVSANLRVPEVIHPGEVFLVPLGFAMNLSGAQLAAFLLPRSGLGHKAGVVLGNLVGLIDGDYQGQVFASVWNRNRKEAITIYPGDRIAQLMLTPLVQSEFTVVEGFDTETARAEGGFGSTGVSADKE